MSLIGAWFAKFAASMGGALPAGAIVSGGLIIGILVGAGTGGGFGGGGAPGPSIETSDVLPCPDMGPRILSVKGGQHVWITGKTADGKFLRIHVGGPGVQEGFVPAEAYSLLGSLDDVPVVSCTQEALIAFAPSPAGSMTATGSFEPSESPSAAPSSPPSATPAAAQTATPRATATPRGTPRATPRVTPGPTKAPTPRPTPTPAPTPPPDTTDPSVGVPDANPSSIASCSGSQSSSISTEAFDNPGGSGIARVTLKVFDASGTQLFTKRMTSAGSGLYEATLSTGDAFPGGQGTYPIRATAVDKAGNSATSSASRITVIKSDFC